MVLYYVHTQTHIHIIYIYTFICRSNQNSRYIIIIMFVGFDYEMIYYVVELLFILFAQFNSIQMKKNYSSAQILYRCKNV